MSNDFAIAVLISGGGTTLKNLILQIELGNLNVRLALVVSSSAKAKGLEFARNAGIDSAVVQRAKCESTEDFSQQIFDRCRAAKVDLIVMGGFLKRVTIPADFANRVINIHPSLIPAFCGQGMYGVNVHQAVIEYGAKLSGCTVHFVDDEYDHGPIIAQSPVDVLPDDTPESLAKRVFERECELYPRIINSVAKGRVSVSNRVVTVAPID